MNKEGKQDLIMPGDDLFIFLEVFQHEGGIQTYNRALLRAYESLPEMPGARVLIMRDSPTCDNPFRNSPKLQFFYFRGKSLPVERIRIAIALLLHLLKRRPRQVFCGHINLLPLVQPLCQWLNLPFTVITHGKEVWSPLASANQRRLQQASQIWTVSRYSRDRAAAANHLDPKKFCLLSCPVDGTQFTPGPRPTHLADRYRLQDAQVLMTVARLWSGDPYKGVDVTIRALPKILSAFPDVKYLVVGRGDDQPRLARLAEELGVSDRVVFAGFVPTEELVEHYRLADAYIMPSQEGFGIVYLEAMACGKPVLAGDDDGSADPLQDGRLGWQVPHRDPEAVAAACIEILQGNQQRTDGGWLRQEALAAFGFDAFTQRLEKFLSLNPRQ